MDIESAAARWVEVSELAPGTLERYLTSLLLVVRWGIGTVEGLTRQEVRRYLAARRDGGASAQTCNRDLAACQSLVRWLESRGEIGREAVEGLRGLALPCPPHPPARYLTREQWATWREAARDVDEGAEVASVLAVGAGLRAGEIRALAREHLVIDGPAPYVRVTRDDLRRLKHLHSVRSAALAPSLAAWLAERARPCASSSTTRPGRRCSPGRSRSGARSARSRAARSPRGSRPHGGRPGLADAREALGETRGPRRSGRRAPRDTRRGAPRDPDLGRAHCGGSGPEHPGRWRGRGRRRAPPGATRCCIRGRRRASRCRCRRPRRAPSPRTAGSRRRGRSRSGACGPRGRGSGPSSRPSRR